MIYWIMNHVLNVKFFISLLSKTIVIFLTIWNRKRYLMPVDTVKLERNKSNHVRHYIPWKGRVKIWAPGLDKVMKINHWNSLFFLIFFSPFKEYVHAVNILSFIIMLYDIMHYLEKKNNVLSNISIILWHLLCRELSWGSDWSSKNDINNVFWKLN